MTIPIFCWSLLGRVSNKPPFPARPAPRSGGDYRANEVCLLRARPQYCQRNPAFTTAPSSGAHTSVVHRPPGPGVGLMIGS